MLRSFYNARTDSPKFNRLTFVLLGVASPFDLLQDKEYQDTNFFNTPLNIGTAIALKLKSSQIDYKKTADIIHNWELFDHYASLLIPY